MRGLASVLELLEGLVALRKALFLQKFDEFHPLRFRDTEITSAKTAVGNFNYR